MIIKFETAKLAKEKGFDLKVWYNYNYLGELDKDLGVGWGIDEGIEDATDLKCNFNYIDSEYLKYEQSSYDRVAELTLEELRVEYNNPDIDEIEKDRIQTNATYSLNNYIHQCSAPTQSELQTWLRDVHNISVTIDSHLKKHPELDYFYMIYDVKNHHIHRNKFFNSYEEALEQGLIEALKLI